MSCLSGWRDNLFQHCEQPHYSCWRNLNNLNERCRYWSHGQVRMFADWQHKRGITLRHPNHYQQCTNKIFLRIVQRISYLQRWFYRVGLSAKELLKKWAPDSFTFDSEQTKSFDSHIDKVCSPPVLELSSANLPYSLDWDASNEGIGCSLFRTYPDGERKSIAFLSHSILPDEENSLASEWELLALVGALKKVRL